MKRHLSADPPTSPRLDVLKPLSHSMSMGKHTSMDTTRGSIPLLEAFIPQAVRRRILSELESSDNAIEVFDENTSLERQEEKAPHFEAVSGATMFADISGYTTLANKLANEAKTRETKFRSRRGSTIKNPSPNPRASLLSSDTQFAEFLSGHDAAGDLSTIMKTVLDKLINCISAAGGDIVSFCGDALLILFSSPTIATECGLRLLSVPVEAGYPGDLGMHIGIGLGESIGIVTVGGFERKWESFLVGASLQEMFSAQKVADRGQLVVSRQVHDALLKAGDAEYTHGDVSETVLVKSFRENGQEAPRGNTRPSSPREPSFDTSDYASHLKEHTPDSFLVSAKYSLSNVKKITCLFVRMDIQNADLSLSQTFTISVQQSCSLFGATLRQVVVDDKGLVAVIVVGISKHVHVDQPARGVKMAVDILSRLHPLSARIGIATGPAFCGILGNRLRCDYAVMGKAVNLAARLMGQAVRLKQRILLDESTFKGCRHQHFQLDSVGKLQLKGHIDPVETYKFPLDEVEMQAMPMHSLSLSHSFGSNGSMSSRDGSPKSSSVGFGGKEREITLFKSFFRYAKSHRGSRSYIGILYGDRGSGKTSLLKRLFEIAVAERTDGTSRGWGAFIGGGHSFLSNDGAHAEASYSVWIPIVRAALKQAQKRASSSSNLSTLDLKKIARVESAARRSSRSLRRIVSSHTLQQKAKTILRKRSSDLGRPKRRNSDLANSNRRKSSPENINAEPLQGSADGFSEEQELRENPLTQELDEDEFTMLCKLLGVEKPRSAGAPKTPRIGKARSSGTHVSQHSEIAAVVVKLLRNRQPPTMFFLDDLQWFDAASTELLLHMYAHYPDIIFVLTSRPTAVFRQEFSAHKNSSYHIDHKHAVHDKLSDIGNVSVSVLPMTSLELAQVLTGYYKMPFDPSLVNIIREKTSGNPLDAIDMAYEMFEMGITESGESGVVLGEAGEAATRNLVPSSAKDLLVARFSRLSNEQKCAVWCMSAIGMDSPSKLLFDVLRVVLRGGGDEGVEVAGGDDAASNGDAVAEANLRSIMQSIMTKRIVSCADNAGTIDNANYCAGEVYSFFSFDAMNVLYNTITPERRRFIHAVCFKTLLRTSERWTGDTYYLLGYHSSRAGWKSASLLCFQDAKLRAYAAHDYFLALKCIECSIQEEEDIVAGHESMRSLWLLERGMCEYLVRQSEELREYDVSYIAAAREAFHDEMAASRKEILVLASSQGRSRRTRFKLALVKRRARYGRASLDLINGLYRDEEAVKDAMPSFMRFSYSSMSSPVSSSTKRIFDTAKRKSPAKLVSRHFRKALSAAGIMHTEAPLLKSPHKAYYRACAGYYMAKRALAVVTRDKRMRERLDAQVRERLERMQERSSSMLIAHMGRGASVEAESSGRRLGRVLGLGSWTSPTRRRSLRSNSTISESSVASNIPRTPSLEAMGGGGGRKGSGSAFF